MATPPRIPWLPVLGAAVAAVIVFARTIDGGLLSDDLLFNVLCRADGSVDWASVFADFGRPWLGFDAPFYRPLLTLSFAIDQTIGQGAAAPFHVTNLALHAAVAATTAAICAMVAPSRRDLAAWVGGLAVAVHPVAVEPVAWIAARNSELEVAFRTLAMLAFVAHLRSGRAQSRVAALLLGACAFATKESAVMLPISLLALDVLVEPTRSLRARLRLHTPFVALVVAYFVLRLWLFGALVGDGGNPASGSAAARFAGKMLALVAADAPCVSSFLLGLVALASFVRAPGVLLLGAAWVALHAVPTFRLGIDADLGGSRMVYGALVALAIVIGHIGARAPIAATFALAAWIAVVPTTWSRLDAYDAAWRDMDDAAAGIGALADRATPERPLALAAMPVNAPGIPPCNPNAWFALAERPRQPRDVPVVSLGFVTLPVPRAEALYHDAASVHAVAELGSAIAAWDPSQRRFLVRQRQGATGDPPALREGPPGTFTFAARPPAADEIEALTVHVAGGRPRGAHIRFVTSVADLPRELAGLDVGVGTPEGDGARIDVDLTHHMGPVSLATYALPIGGFTIELEGDGRVSSVDAHRRVQELDVAGRLDGAVATFEDLAAITAPAVDGGATLRLVLLGPHAAIPVECVPGAPVRVPDEIAREFEGFARVARQDGLWFWFEAMSAPGQPGFARSRVDRFALRSR